MKPNSDTEICDKCKDRIGKYICIGCQCSLCSGCSHMLRLQMSTMDFETEGVAKHYQTSLTSFFPQMPDDNKNLVGTIDWAICKDCKKSFNKKDVIEEIQNSSEMKAFIDKIRKITMASAILTGLDDSEVSNKVTGSNIGGMFQTPPIQNLFPKQSFLNKILSKRRKFIWW